MGLSKAKCLDERNFENSNLKEKDVLYWENTQSYLIWINTTGTEVVLIPLNQLVYWLMQFLLICKAFGALSKPYSNFG